MSRFVTAIGKCYAIFTLLFVSFVWINWEAAWNGNGSGAISFNGLVDFMCVPINHLEYIWNKGYTNIYSAVFIAHSTTSTL